MLATCVICRPFIFCNGKCVGRRTYKYILYRKHWMRAAMHRNAEINVSQPQRMGGQSEILLNKWKLLMQICVCVCVCAVCCATVGSGCVTTFEIEFVSKTTNVWRQNEIAPLAHRRTQAQAHALTWMDHHHLFDFSFFSKIYDCWTFEAATTSIKASLYNLYVVVCDFDSSSVTIYDDSFWRVYGVFIQLSMWFEYVY